MVNFKGSFFSILILILVFTSCSIHKRVYRPGYQIVWNHDKLKESNLPAGKAGKETEQKIKVAEAHLEEVVTASNDGDLELIKLKKDQALLLNPDTCGDVLLLKNGEELKVKVLEVHETEIKYKRCDNLNGPIYNVSKNKVALIKYSNGAVEKFEAVQENKPMITKPSAAKKMNGWGLASFICAAVGILLGLTLIIAIPFAIISLKEFKKEPDKYDNKWMPMAALIINIVIFGLGAILFLTIGLLWLTYSGGAGIFFIIAAICAALSLGSGIALSMMN